MRYLAPLVSDTVPCGTSCPDVRRGSRGLLSAPRRPGRVQQREEFAECSKATPVHLADSRCSNRRLVGVWDWVLRLLDLRGRAFLVCSLTLETTKPRCWRM